MVLVADSEDSLRVNLTKLDEVLIKGENCGEGLKQEGVLEKV